MYLQFLLIVHFIIQNLDEAHSSPGLHAAAGPGLLDECGTLVRLRLFILQLGFYLLLYP